MRKEHRLYNVLFPVWLLIWIPSWLWLILIPANWLIDWLVLRFSLKRTGVEDYSQKAMKFSPKICLAGFLADFIGSGVLLGISLLTSDVSGQLSQALTLNPFMYLPAFLITCAAILLSSFCIYHFDRRILVKDTSLTKEQVHQAALTLAGITAPYLFLIPASLIY